jgi:hypothetical protein
MRRTGNTSASAHRMGRDFNDSSLFLKWNSLDRAVCPQTSGYTAHFWLGNEPDRRVKTAKLEHVGSTHHLIQPKGSETESAFIYPVYYSRTFEPASRYSSWKGPLSKGLQMEVLCLNVEAVEPISSKHPLKIFRIGRQQETFRKKSEISRSG